MEQLTSIVLSTFHVAVVCGFLVINVFAAAPALKDWKEDGDIELFLGAN